MKLIKAMIRPSKLDDVIDELTKIGVQGMTVTAVHGFGRQKGNKTVYRGAEYVVHLLEKKMLDIVVPDDLAQPAVDAIMRVARTGEIGDGKVFVLPVDEDYTIRTGERKTE